MDDLNNINQVNQYDAFISYRHLPLDMAVASKLQELLESYRPPKNVDELRGRRINRIFRDKSELPTSGDLGNGIREALRNSRYLIVVCSEHTKDSKWCMEEIRQFKEYHNGSTDHILTILVSGEPDNVFPEHLLRETREETEVDGTKRYYEVNIEPLCGDVRAKTIKKSLKRLKTEFLRIAAPLLGCGFDTLYQRHMRRKRKQNGIILSSSAGLLTAVLLTVSIFAYKTWVSEREYRNILAENYMRQGSEYSLSDDPQKALLYFSEAIATSPDNLPAASAGVSLLLQEYSWPVMEEILPGRIVDGEYVPLILSTSSEIDGHYLSIALTSIRVCDKSGDTLKELPIYEDEYYSYLGKSAGQWAFKSENLYDAENINLYLYNPITDTMRTVPKPDGYSKNYNKDDLIFAGYDIRAIDENRAILTGGGLVRLVSFDSEGNMEVLSTVDLADAFPLSPKDDYVSLNNSIWISDDCSYIAVNNLNSLAIFSTDGLIQCGYIENKNYLIHNVEFDGDGNIAAAYGNPYSLSGGYLNPGGYFAVYTIDGKVVYESAIDHENIIIGTEFLPTNKNILLVWSQNQAALFDIEQKKYISAPIYTNNIGSACFYDGNSICLSSSVGSLDNEVSVASSTVKYRFIDIPDSNIDNPLSEGEGKLNTLYSQDKRIVYGPEGKTLTTDGQTLTMLDSEGNILVSSKLPSILMGSIIALSEDSKTLYLGDTVYYSGLLTADIDFDKNTIGDFITIDTEGKKIINMWSLKNSVIIETSSRELLIYDRSGEKLFSAVPKHKSLPISIVCDSNMQYIAIVLEETITEEGVIGFDQNSFIEIWDISSGLLLTDYEVIDDEIEFLSITDDGILEWGTSDNTYIRYILTSSPDKASLEFLQSICSLKLNDRQENVYKVPSQSNLPDNSWFSALGNWEQSLFESEGNMESEDEFDSIYYQMKEADNAGTLEWLNSCDDIWESLLADEIEYDIQDLDSFFNMYSIYAINNEMVDSIGYGLQTYFDLSEKLCAESVDEVSSLLFTNVLSLLRETQSFDSVIADEFLEIADINERMIAEKDERMKEESDENIAFMWEEVDKPTLIVSTYYLKGWAELLTNPKSCSQFVEMSNYCLDYDMFVLYYADSTSLAFMILGNSQKAAEATNSALKLYTLGMSEDDIEYVEKLWLKAHLEALGSLVFRGGIDQQIANEYLENLNAEVGIEITEINSDAQEKGFAIGDLITSIDGKMIADISQARRILSENENALCTVKRNGEEFTLTISYGIAYKMHNKIITDE